MRQSDPWRPSGWQSILYGLVSLGIGLLLYFLLSLKESGGGSMRVHWFVALAYWVGGKWVVGGLPAFIGVSLLGFGVYDIIKKD